MPGATTSALPAGYGGIPSRAATRASTSSDAGCHEGRTDNGMLIDALADASPQREVRMSGPTATKYVCRNVCRSVPPDGVGSGQEVPVPEHRTRGPHRPPSLFSPLLYQLSYLALNGRGIIDSSP